MTVTPQASAQARVLCELLLSSSPGPKASEVQADHTSDFVLALFLSAAGRAGGPVSASLCVVCDPQRLFASRWTVAACHSRPTPQGGGLSSRLPVIWQHA